MHRKKVGLFVCAVGVGLGSALALWRKRAYDPLAGVRLFTANRDVSYFPSPRGPFRNEFVVLKHGKSFADAEAILAPELRMVGFRETHRKGTWVTYKRAPGEELAVYVPINAGTPSPPGGVCVLYRRDATPIEHLASRLGLKM